MERERKKKREHKLFTQYLEYTKCSYMIAVLIVTYLLSTSI